MSRRTRRSLSALALVWAGLAPRPALRADDDLPQVQVQADRPRPAANEVVRLTYTFTGSGVGGALRLVAPLPLKNLVVVGGPSSGTRIEFINGIVRRSASVTYYLRPQGAGSAEVAESSWVVGEKTVKAPGYLFEVGPARSGIQQQQESDEDADPFDRLFPRAAPPPQQVPGQSRRMDAQRAAAYLEYVATPSQTTAYVGEEVVVTYELMTQVDITGLEYVDPPKFPGLWAEDLEKPEKPQGRRDVVNGQVVLRFTLLRKGVSGIAPGTVTIPPARVRLAIRGGDPWDPFGMLRQQVVERETKPVTLTILPIPEKPDFTGPVGRFDLTARVDRTRVSAGDAVSLRVKLAGTGSLRTATGAPHVQIPGATVYDPSARTEGGKPTAGARGPVSTEWTWVVVPEKAGELRIPPVTVEVFDPTQKKIVSKATAPLVVTVEPGSAAANAPPASPAAAEPAAASPVTAEARQATTIDPPKPGTSSKGDGPTLPPATVDLRSGTVTLPLWLLVAAPVAFVLAGGAVWALRRRRPTAHLSAALAGEPGETKERAAARIERAVREWLHARHGLAEGASIGTVEDTLAARAVPDDLRREISSLLSELEFLRFAPQLGDYAAKIRDVRERAARLLPKLK